MYAMKYYEAVKVVYKVTLCGNIPCKEDSLRHRLSGRIKK